MSNLVKWGAFAVGGFLAYKIWKGDLKIPGLGAYTPRDLDRQTRAAAGVGRYAGGGLLSLRNTALPQEGPYPGGGLLGLRG